MLERPANSGKPSGGRFLNLGRHTHRVAKSGHAAKCSLAESAPTSTASAATSSFNRPPKRAIRMTLLSATGIPRHTWMRSNTQSRAVHAVDTNDNGIRS
jgi:hypothetical protein